MTLRDLLQVMNIYEVECFDGDRMETIKLKDWQTNPFVILNGNKPVRSITDIARQGITIWLD